MIPVTPIGVARKGVSLAGRAIFHTGEEDMARKKRNREREAEERQRATFAGASAMGRSENNSVRNNERVLNQGEKNGAHVLDGEAHQENPNEYEGVNQRDLRNTQRQEQKLRSENSKESVRRSRWQSYRAKRKAKKLAILEKEQEKEQIKREKSTIFSYSPALLVALLKDLLDFTFIGSLPLIGTVVTFCFSILIFILLLFVKSNSKLMDSKFIIRRALLLLFGTLIEMFGFGINFFPIETITVGLILFLDGHLSEESIRKVDKALQILKKLKV